MEHNVDKSEDVNNSVDKESIQYTSQLNQMDLVMDLDGIMLEDTEQSNAATVLSSELNKRKKKPRSKMPPHIKNLMGEANLRFARGDVETAEKICYEVIRQWPRASEAFLTLAQLLETKDPEKSLQLQFMAAVTNGSDVNLWISTAQRAEERNNLKLTISCYNFALAVDKDNCELHKKRIELLEKTGNKSSLIRAYVRYLSILIQKNPQEFLDVSLKVALLYNQITEYNKAIETLDFAFKKYPELVSPEMVNIMLDLLINIKNYTYCLDLFCQYCNIEMEVMIGEQNKVNVLSCSVPENIPIDFRVKFIICLIKLEAFSLLEELLKPIMEYPNLCTVADLYLDLAEALMASKQFVFALKLIIPLIKDKNLSLPAVWLKYGECLVGCNMFEQAVDAFQTVMDMAPQHTDVKIMLVDALLKLNRIKEALVLLEQNSKLQPVDVGILLKQISVFKEIGFYDKLFKSVELLLLRHSIKLKHYEELRAVMYSETQTERMARLQKLRQIKNSPEDETLTFTVTKEPTLEEEYKLLKDTLQLCKEKRKYTTLQKLTFTALTSSKFKDKIEELQLLAFYASVLNRDSCNAYPLLRNMLLHYKTNNLIWNLYNCILQFAESLRHTRFLTNFLDHNVHDSQIRAIEANHCIESGSYKLAMMYYLNATRNNYSSLYLLILGITLLQICCQKFTLKKEKLISTCISIIIAYSNVRSFEAYEEIYYNLGRLFQHIGFYHIAIEYYKRVLNNENLQMKKFSNLSLKRETAFNLHLIYRESGNHAAAKELIMKYIRI